MLVPRSARLILPNVCMFQAKSRTSARGKAASGGSPAPTSWRGTTASTPARSRSAAATASAASPAPTTWRCTPSATRSPPSLRLPPNALGTVFRSAKCAAHARLSVCDSVYVWFVVSHYVILWNWMLRCHVRFALCRLLRRAFRCSAVQAKDCCVQ